MLDHNKLRAALLIGLKPKGKDGEEPDGEAGPAEGEDHLRECLARMYDAIHAGDKEAFVEAGVECMMEDYDAEADKQREEEG